jgi:hypothetical protein
MLAVGDPEPDQLFAVDERGLHRREVVVHQRLLICLEGLL